MEQIANLNNASLLYDVLGKHIPPIPILPEDYLDFIDGIIGSIQQNQDYDAYYKAIQILTGVTPEIIQVSTPEDVLDLFINGLSEWRIVDLVGFFRNLGYENG